MSKPGWIKLYNQTVDSDFWIDPAPFSHRDAFFHVLMSANWRPGVTHIHGRKFTIERGQWLTSIRKLAVIFHWSRDRVYKWLEIMKDYDMIQSESVGFGTLLTVVNYEKFQNSADSKQDSQQDSKQDTQQDSKQDSQQDTKPTQSKNIYSIRQQTSDNVSAPPERPASGEDPEDDDDDGMTLEEARRYWESLQ